MRKAILVRLTIIIVVFLLMAAVITAIFRGKPEKPNNMTGMKLSNTTDPGTDFPHMFQCPPPREQPFAVFMKIV
ncbi:MAG: hypothetical protein MRJ65_10600 [Candidatus Brocadiaceae bacterium]|nr:hypothetical protein [Candidatus Brocadiaceae bacterium]